MLGIEIDCMSNMDQIVVNFFNQMLVYYRTMGSNNRFLLNN